MKRFYGSRGFVGVRLCGFYVSLRSPRHRAYFSERNRIKCSVYPLVRGWRIVVLARKSAMATTAGGGE